MTVLFEEMTREQINAVAPGAIAVWPTTATQQRGPHMAVGTDTLLTTVARRAADAIAAEVPVVITPRLGLLTISTGC
ncbi:uncharacterized protein METZ01_LOCUS454630 [marine metagenome]|uniref:Creatininase n=1 Tax=marine metagenome TaxID=408172 RepID=A0A383A1I8_9ZZZZ